MTERRSPPSRIWLYLPFGIAGVVLIAYCLLWRAGAAEMKSAVYQWVDGQRAAGFSVDHGAVKSDGFPFFLRVHIEKPAVTTPEGWRWRSGRLTIDALPYDLNRLIFSVRSEQEISDRGGEPWIIAADDFRASIARDKTRGWVYAMTIGDAAARRASGGASVKLEALVLDLAPDSNDPGTIQLNLAAAGFELSSAAGPYSVESLQTSLSLSHTHMFAGHEPVQNWRSAGGELAISGLQAQLEGARISAEGRLRLDRANFPAGALNTEIQNPAGLSELLRKAGALTQAEAETAGAQLSLLAIANGGKVIAPVVLEDGAASVAGVKLADLDKID